MKKGTVRTKMRPPVNTLSPKQNGIRHKLSLAFALMAVIPMLVCGYLIFYYIYPVVHDFWNVSLIFMITMLLMLIGFFLAKRIIAPITEITAHAKGIVAGKLSKNLDVRGEDELGELSGSLNRLSLTLRANMAELNSYEKKIKQINMEINRKVFALSSLLQIGNLITTTASLDEVLSLIVEKLAQLQTEGMAFLMFLDQDSSELIMHTQVNMNTEKIKRIKIKIGQGPLGKIVSNLNPLIIDAQNRIEVVDEDLRNILQTKNLTILPVTSSGRVIAVLGAGSNAQDFSFTEDEIEVIGVFTKQVTVAVENDTLIRKTEELAVTDKLTGLYNENYIRSRLDEEIKRAISYQRPCSFIIFELNNFEEYRQAQGEIVAEQTLRNIAQILKEIISDIDKAARFGDCQFAVLAPEKNKHQAMEFAGNLLERIEKHNLGRDKLKSPITLTLNAGISATPIDGTTAVQLIDKGLFYIGKAKNEGQNKIVGS